MDILTQQSVTDYSGSPQDRFANNLVRLSHLGVVAIYEENEHTGHIDLLRVAHQERNNFINQTSLTFQLLDFVSAGTFPHPEIYKISQDSKQSFKSCVEGYSDKLDKSTSLALAAISEHGTMLKRMKEQKPVDYLDKIGESIELSSKSALSIAQLFDEMIQEIVEIQKKIQEGIDSAKKGDLLNSKKYEWAMTQIREIIENSSQFSSLQNKVDLLIRTSISENQRLTDLQRCVSRGRPTQNSVKEGVEVGVKIVECSLEAAHYVQAMKCLAIQKLEPKVI